MNSNIATPFYDLIVNVAFCYLLYYAFLVNLRAIADTEALTVAVHSDERAVPPPEAREGAGRDANMIYVAGDARAGGDYSQVCMSVHWDDVHGDRVEPRPILTYHPELLDGGDRPLAGEVASSCGV